MTGFNSALNASLSSMDSNAKRTSITSSNIANANTNAYKRLEGCSAAIVSQNGMIGGVDTTIRQLIDTQGEFSRTEVSTDLAIEGAGFAIVTDGFNGSTPKNIFVTRDLSFRKDNSNMLVNASGYYLLAWNVDANGQLPATKSLLSSLNGVNVFQWTSQASSTTEVDFGANLVSQQAVVGNSVGTINITNRGIKPSPINAYASANDILYTNPNNSLTEGEGLEMTIDRPNGQGAVTKKILFGGFAQTFTFLNSGTNLTTAVGGQLAGDTIQLSYGNQSIAVTRGNGATNREVLQNIADQINANSPSSNGVQAQIFDLGTSTHLAIAPTNINQSLIFSGTLAFRNQMGLDDSKNISAFTPDVQGVTIGRFATLKQFCTILNSAGVTATISDDEAIGANITLISSLPIAFNNYQPLGRNSDFLSEFGLPQGYMTSTYDPYLSSKNMAGGSFNSHFSQNITIYDSMGNAHNILLTFLKTGVNQWGVEVYAVDPLSVNIPGRTDGLLMASTITFDGAGNFLSIQSSPQYSYSNPTLVPNSPLGATAGQTFTVGVGSSSYSFTYNNLFAGSSLFIPSAAGLAGVAADTLDITVGSTTHNIARGTGATNIEVLNNIANQINQTIGTDAICAKIMSNTITGQVWLDIRAADSTQAVAFAQTGTIGTDLGITSADDIASNSFQSLYELAEQINTTQGPTAIRATIIPGGPNNGSYVLKIAPVNSSFYMTFGGTSAVISPPLGNGTSQTIASALGLNNTVPAQQLVSINQPLTINWSNIIGANPNVINFNWGTFGTTDGMGQSSGTYSILKANQNGVSTGDLTGVAIDKEGWVTASFSNSLTRRIYKLPVGDFANPNGLIEMPGNVFKISSTSGPLNLKEAGQNGAGNFVPGALEGSNVDLGKELTSLIFTQHVYQGSAKILGVTDKLLDHLLSSF